MSSMQEEGETREARWCFVMVIRNAKRHFVGRHSGRKQMAVTCGTLSDIRSRAVTHIMGVIRDKAGPVVTTAEGTTHMMAAIGCSPTNKWR